MTSAEFVRKYRLLKLVAERGARSHIAQEISLGRMVMVHRLEVGTPAEREQLLSRARSLDPAAAAKVFTIDEVDGVSVIITHFLASFTDLPTWLAENSGEGVPPTAAPISSRPAAPPPGEFTRIFQGTGTPPSTPKTTPPAQPVAAAPPPPKPTPAPEPAIGGFTSVFGKLPAELHSTPPTSAGPATPAAPSRPATPASPPPASLSSSKLPNSPTPPRFEPVMPPVNYDPPPPPPPPEVKAPSQPAPGDFTQLFQRLGANDKIVSPPTPPPPPPTPMPAKPAFAWDPASAPTNPPVARPAPAAPIVPSPTPAAGPSEFTRVLGRVGPTGGPGPQTPSGSAASTPGGVPRPNLPPPSPAAPTPAPAPAAPAPAAPAPAAPKKSLLPVIIGVNVVVIIVIIVVLYFVMKH